MCLQTDRRHQDKHKLLYASTMASEHNKTITHPSVQTECLRAEVPYLSRAASVVIWTIDYFSKLKFLVVPSKHTVLCSNVDNTSVILTLSCCGKIIVKLGLYLFWGPRLSVGEVGGSPVWSAHCCRWSEAWEGAHGEGAVPLEPY